jgi:hypothetical protein
MSALNWQRPSSIDRRNKRLGNGEARSRRHRINRAVGPIRPRSFRVHANYLDALNALPVRIHRQKPKALGLKFGCGFTWHLSIKVLRLRECCRGAPFSLQYWVAPGLPGPESDQSNRHRFIWSSSDGRAQDSA